MWGAAFRGRPLLGCAVSMIVSPLAESRATCLPVWTLDTPIPERFADVYQNKGDAGRVDADLCESKGINGSSSKGFDTTALPYKLGFSPEDRS
jgi:hypothetical protein